MGLRRITAVACCACESRPLLALLFHDHNLEGYDARGSDCAAHGGGQDDRFGPLLPRVLSMQGTHQGLAVGGSHVSSSQLIALYSQTGISKRSDTTVRVYCLSEGVRGMLLAEPTAQTSVNGAVEAIAFHGEAM